MPDQIDQVLPAGTTDPCEPILDRPFPRTRPSHDDFDGLVGGPQLVPQSIGDCHGVRPEILAIRKNYALFRQHSADPPQLEWLECGVDRMETIRAQPSALDLTVRP